MDVCVHLCTDTGDDRRYILNHHRTVPVVFIGDENAECAPAFLSGKEQRMLKRRRFKQTKSLKERLLERAEQFREEAKLLPYGLVRDAVIKRARQAEAAAHMDEWLNSPGLQPPKKHDTPGPN